jgi:hypothetical protein
MLRRICGAADNKPHVVCRLFNILRVQFLKVTFPFETKGCNAPARRPNRTPEAGPPNTLLGSKALRSLKAERRAAARGPRRCGAPRRDVGCTAARARAPFALLAAAGGDHRAPRRRVLRRPPRPAREARDPAPASHRERAPVAVNKGHQTANGSVARAAIGGCAFALCRPRAAAPRECERRRRPLGGAQQQAVAPVRVPGRDFAHS